LSDSYVTETALRDMLAARDLLSINIDSSYWALNKSPTEFLSEIGNEKTVIKLYCDIDEMLGDAERRIITRYKMQFLSVSEPTTTYEYWEY
jgi:hypothetical protein